jgi:uncharacterized membrane protein
MAGGKLTMSSEEPLTGRDDSPSPEGAFDDAKMEIIMGRLLQTGVLIAATVVLVGGVLYVFAHAGERSNYRVFVARPVGLRHPKALLRGIVANDASAIILLGILLLVATPICRVIFAVIAFAWERDRLYVAVSLLVLAVLLFGMVRGG